MLHPKTILFDIISFGLRECYFSLTDVTSDHYNGCMNARLYFIPGEMCDQVEVRHDIDRLLAFINDNAGGVWPIEGAATSFIDDHKVVCINVSIRYPVQPLQ